MPTLRLALFDKRELRAPMKTRFLLILATNRGCVNRRGMLLRRSTLSRYIRQLEDSIDMNCSGDRAAAFGRWRPGRDFFRAARPHCTDRGGRLAINVYTSLSAGNLRASPMDIRQRFPQIESIKSLRTRLVATLRNDVVDVACGLR